ncbi:hypothetical protein ACZ90_07260 [Streptomyces albus subsp. albus]|nr:hypothetical protein ACZ90_07260 [Streptomyces albus subsp. albus]
MSSSGLIYAVIVGAWAAYLVPMWLRRQDELNEARPTERFSTAIRLLSGRAAMERRYARELEARAAQDADHPEEGMATADPGQGVSHPDAETDVVDVRAFVDPVADPAPFPDPAPATAVDHAVLAPDQARPAPGRPTAATLERSRRAKVLARRRRTTVVLFMAFTLGAVVAAVGGLAFLWAPGIPAVLLSAYIAYLRAQERRRYAFTMDQQRAELAAQRLRERGSRERAHRAPAAPADEDPADHGPAGPAPRPARERAAATTRDPHPQQAEGHPGRSEAHPPRAEEPAPQAHPAREARAERPARAEQHQDAAERNPGRKRTAPAAEPAAAERAADRRALVEQTDHAEWVDQQRERGPATGESWEPVPVPLPTYVTAPVAPRASGSVDLDAPDAWSSARSSAAGPAAEPPSPASAESAPRPRQATPRRARERGRTPLFDQYADEDRPRAANE